MPSSKRSGNHLDRWVRETAQAALNGLDEHMKELIALKRVPLFSTLSLEQLASIDRLMVTRRYAEGRADLPKGRCRAPSSMWSWTARSASTSTTTVRRSRWRSLGVGKVVGEMSVFDDQPRSASAQANVDTTVRVLRRDRMQAIVHEHPEVLLEFVKNLSQRLRAMDEQLEAALPQQETIREEAAGAAME